MKVACAGAGLSCAVIARQLAEFGHQITVFEEREHIAGNCYTETDTQTGVLVHKYGPHIFHTDSDIVWEYVNRFTSFKPYIHRVKATAVGEVFSLPINLHTINQFYKRVLSPAQAKAFLFEQKMILESEAQNFEEQALQFVGKSLYETFFKFYTQKQWGIDPIALPASIIKRLPVRFNYDDNYFFHQHQGMPASGYSDLVANILNHKNIVIQLGKRLNPKQIENYDHTFWSGPLDGFFDYSEGRLPYRTLDFQKFYADDDFQGCAVMNYCDEDVPYTRITEHKHFMPWKSFEGSICYKEFSRDCKMNDIPYYPVHFATGNDLLTIYQNKARNISNVTFVGRLGSYRYLDMDVCIAEALKIASGYI